MTNCVSQVAATIIQRIQHPCDFRESGCNARCDINTISEHEESCNYRLVRCPHWACDDQASVRVLSNHVLSNECSDNHRSKSLPYQEEMEYTRALDDHEGNSNWRPSMLMYDGVTFYLQVEKHQDKQWYFYVQMEGSASECQKYETKLSVCKFPARRGNPSATTERSAPLMSKVCISLFLINQDNIDYFKVLKSSRLLAVR